jgi:alpha-1,3-glucan synthase
MHIAFTLIAAQVLGSITTIVAKAIAPDNEGPGDVFPDFSFYRLGDSLEIFQNAWFYIGLWSQLVICIGYFFFFRKVYLASGVC